MVRWHYILHSLGNFRQLSAAVVIFNPAGISKAETVQREVDINRTLQEVAIGASGQGKKCTSLTIQVTQMTPLCE